MGKKVLIVDDESRMRKIVGDFLKKDGYEILEASDGEKALDIIYKNKNIDLVILDVMMPNMNGWEVVSELRDQEIQIPVVMLTAKSEEKDELKGFSLGVDEYISKPFSLRILCARIDAILRRSGAEDEQQPIVEGGIEIIPEARVVKVDGQTVDLSIKEYELLMYFMNNKGIALSRERILSQVWDYDYFGDARTIDTHVKKLRSKLGSRGEYIKTVWGMGYKFEVE